MSKKLIAVAAAAALALTGLVGIAPATAAMVTSGTTLQAAEDSLLVTSTVSRTGTGTLADPYTVDVPSSGLATDATTLEFVMSTTAARAITVTATSGIRLLAAVEDDTAVVLTGAGSLTVTTDSNGDAEFFAYPTSTTAGVVTITNDGDITQIYVEGVAGPAYDIVSVTLPALEPEEEGEIVAVVADAFGNVIDSVSNQTLTVTRVGTGSPTGTNVVYSDTSERWEGTITAGATAGQLAVGLTIQGLTATDEQEEAFGEPNNTFFGIINVAAAKAAAAWEADIKVLNDRIAVLTTQLAASRPIATSVTKKKYNTLARKWNAANPGAKVALKK
jgi:hypothetical protein